MTQIDYRLISNLRFEGIDYKDYPDFCDAYIASADYDGEEMSQEMLDELNEDHDYVYDKLMEYLH